MNPKAISQHSSVSQVRTWIFWAFPTIFVLTLLLEAGLPDAVALFCQDVSGWLVVQGATLLGLSAAYDPVTHIYHVAEFRMRLDFGCTAVDSLILLCLLILCAPQRSLGNKLQGVVFCGATLLTLNVLRMIGLGVLGTHAPDWFTFLHEYLRIFFTLLAIGMWILWYERGERVKHWLLWGSATMGCGLATSALLYSVREPILVLLTRVANQLFLLTASAAQWTERLWPMSTNGQPFIKTTGERVAIHSPWSHTTFNLWGDVLSLALLAGLLGGGLLLSLRTREWSRIRRCVKGLAVGGFLLIAIQLMSLVILTWLFIFDPSLDNGRFFLRVESLAVVILTILLALRVLNRSEPVGAA